MFTKVPTVLKPTVGRIVHVRLCAAMAASIKSEPGFRGNSPCEGEVYPLIIARVWPKATYDDGLTVNGQLILDGFGTYWMTSVHYGDQPGQWCWPDIPEPFTELVVNTKSAPPLKNSSGIHADIASQEVRAAVIAGENTSLLHERIAQLTDERDKLQAANVAFSNEIGYLKDQLKTAENNVGHYKALSDRLNEEAQEQARKAQGFGDRLFAAEATARTCAEAHDAMKVKHAATLADLHRAQHKMRDAVNALSA